MQIEITHTIDLFGFINALLCDTKKYATFTNKLKASHFFMTQRMLAKKYPMQINAANLNGINQIAILDMYHNKLCRDGQMPPAWLRTKSGKANTIISKEEQLLNDIKSNLELMSLLLIEFDIEYKSLVQLVNEDYTFVKTEFTKLQQAANGTLPKK